MSAGKVDIQFPNISSFAWTERKQAPYPEVKFDIVEMLDIFVKDILADETRTAILSFWSSKMTKTEKTYIMKKAKEKRADLEKLFQEENYQWLTDGECVYTLETFILAYGQPRVRREMISIIAREEKDSSWYKRYVWLTKRFHEDSIDLVYLANINYFVWSAREYSLEDMLSVVDPLPYETQSAASRLFFYVICLRYIKDWETKSFIENPDMTKPIFYQLYLAYLQIGEGHSFFAEFQGHELSSLIRYAQRRLSAVGTIEDGFGRLFDLYTSIWDTELVNKIADDILSRIEKKSGFNDTTRKCWQVSVKGCDGLSSDLHSAYEDIEEKDKALRAAIVHEVFVSGREAAIEQQIKDAVSELKKNADQEISSAKKDSSEATAQVAKLRSQIAKLQGKIDAQAKEIKDLESENEDLATRLDEADEKLAEIEEMTVPEAERERLETDDPLPEDLELLARTKVVVVGGHGNFHHQLLDRMPNWRCITANKNVSTETLIAHAELIVFMSNHMSHAVYETNKQFCINKGVPYTFMSSNNVTRCLNKIAKEVRQFKK